ncbi:MAG: DUF6020 family protein [Candidatus Ventricola sp.]|nr:DUF6020 family protein [Candidatus Ventricola sp.]
MSFIRRHAALAALLAMLLAALAAPYLIPANPDSAVFRNGTLGLLLVAAAAYPVCEAFSRVNRRTLACGFVWGLLFSFAMGLGAELLHYDGLITGMGSLVRRLAVPVMAAPLLGGVCARILLLRPREQARPLRIPLFAYMLVILLCWLPVWLCFFPANIGYDFAGEYNQHVAGEYSSLHPLLHSVIQNGIITLCEHLVSRTFGLFLLTLLQVLCLSAALAACCTFAQRRGAPAWALCAMTAFFALHPIFSVLAVSTTKDTMFAAALIAYSLLLFELLEAPDEGLARKRCWAALIVLAVLTALLRNNGAFALAFSLPAFIIAARGHRRQAALLSAAAVAASVGVFALLSAAMDCQPMSSRQLLSLPAQQLVRAYNLSPSLTDEDRAEIESWYLTNEGLVLLPHLADPAKGYLDNDRLEAEGSGAFLSLWARHAGDSLHQYIEAFLMLNVGSWYPDDVSHAQIYPEQRWQGQGYLYLCPTGTTQQGFTVSCHLPGVRSFLQRICSSNRYQRVPLISLLFCPAIFFWALIFVCAALVARRQARLLPAVLAVLGLWFSYLLGACTLPRYMLPLFSLAPTLLCAALAKPLSPSDPM